MFKNYFLTALRNIINNRIQSLIQVISLCIGITAAILIGLYAQYEFSHDRFNEKFDRIYRLEYGDQVGLWTRPGHRIKQELPDVENVVRLANWGGRDQVAYVKIPSEDPSLERVVGLEDWFLCDSTVFDVFTFDFIQGDPATALRDPNTCCISESAARKFFGDEDPVGKYLILGHGGGLVNITGVFRDLKNSHIEVNMLLPVFSQESQGNFPRGEPGYLDNWFPDVSYMTYLVLPKSNNPQHVERRVNELIASEFNVDIDTAEFWEGFHLRPLEDIYFATGLKGEKNYCRHGNIRLLRILISIAVFILLLGIINYVNLTTARASLRAREVGIRKVAGASKFRLIGQFLVESVLVALASLIIALALARLMLPGFNELASADLEMGNPTGPWGIYLLAVLLLGMLSGLYPALYLTAFQPVESLSGERAKGSGNLLLRRFLLTFQYIISIVLIIGVLVIFKQLHYMKAADLGFDKEWVLNFGIPGHPLARDISKQKYFRERLMEDPNVLGVAYSSGQIGASQAYGTGSWKINGIEKTPAMFQISPGYFDVLGIELLEGRDLSWDRPGDYLGNNDQEGAIPKIIVNETFVRDFQIESPVNYIIRFEGGGQLEIIGVVRDFHFKSQHEKIEPTWYYWSWVGTLNVKIAPVNVQSTIGYIEELVKFYSPESVFQYTFLDETYARQYIRDEKTARIISNFAIVAILIACLGLFGLSSFMAVRRTKEIGIRKTLGASVHSLFLLLSREFLRWVLLSMLIACPLAWVIMNKWLQSFAYRINIGIWVFAAAVLATFLITFLTVTWQSLKTARTNPVEALRYE